MQITILKKSKENVDDLFKKMWIQSRRMLKVVLTSHFQPPHPHCLTLHQVIKSYFYTLKNGLHNFKNENPRKMMFKSLVDMFEDGIKKLAKRYQKFVEVCDQVIKYFTYILTLFGCSKVPLSFSVLFVFQNCPSI